MAIKAKGYGLGDWGLTKHHERLALGSFIVLPYVSYLGLIGFFILILGWLAAYPQAIWQRLWRQGWGWLTLGIGLSIAAAENPTQAALQSTNLWPFFLFFAGFSLYITRLPNPLQSLRNLAFWLLMASIPISLRAVVEYIFRAPAMVTRFSQAPWMAWLYQTQNYGHRADSVFGHPNVLAAYLVMIFGLGLGLCILALKTPEAMPLSAVSPTPATSAGSRSRLTAYHPATMAWIYGATALIPLGVFGSGSRSGILVLLVQLLITIALLRQHRWARWMGLGLVMATLVGVAYGGVGGRSITYAFSSSAMRVNIWQLSLPLIRQHPWFGVGFGGFQANYLPYSIPDEPLLNHGHNLWLHLAAEAGLPVMLLLTGLVGWICYRAVQCYGLGLLPWGFRPVLAGYGLSFLACVLFSLFDIAFFDARVNLLGWAMLAVLQALSDLARDHHPVGATSVKP
jgi:O-antigen ligase